ncbi:hypothetical protein F2Q68_00016274 [Brassica cretica]|uniref:Uncharacterized protein n=1 Tax=Brassica cretica TaxID=69181 RepID=A0A8S9HHD5_BRACR|nr:hypothetical protein F2Q68_00016274 [Brassica cretica]
MINTYPPQGSSVHRLDKEIKLQQKSENGNGLVINGARDVARENSDESSSDKASSCVPHLFTEEVSHDGGGDHETWIKRASDDTAERVPALGVEPVPELVEAFLLEEECWVRANPPKRPT